MHRQVLKKARTVTIKKQNIIFCHINIKYDISMIERNVLSNIDGDYGDNYGNEDDINNEGGDDDNDDDDHRDAKNDGSDNERCKADGDTTDDGGGSDSGACDNNANHDGYNNDRVCRGGSDCEGIVDSNDDENDDVNGGDGRAKMIVY